VSLPTISATGRVLHAPQVRATGDGLPVLRVLLLCEDGHRATRLSVDLLGARARALEGALEAGDTVRVAGHLVARTTRAGHLLYTLQAHDLDRIDTPGEAA